jgi:hypothetical protein
MWSSPADYVIRNSPLVNFIWVTLDESERQQRHAAVANMLSRSATEAANVGQEVRWLHFLQRA